MEELVAVKLLGAVTVIVAFELVSDVSPPEEAVMAVEVAVPGVLLATHPMVVKVAAVEVALLADASREFTAKLYVVHGRRLVRPKVCEVTRVPVSRSGVVDPKLLVGPSVTREDAASFVVHVIDAVVEAVEVATTSLIIGAVKSPVVKVQVLVALIPS
jgi:hypothetical protein